MPASSLQPSGASLGGFCFRFCPTSLSLSYEYGARSFFQLSPYGLWGCHSLYRGIGAVDLRQLAWDDRVLSATEHEFAHQRGGMIG